MKCEGYLSSIQDGSKQDGGSQGKHGECWGGLLSTQGNYIHPSVYGVEAVEPSSCLGHARRGTAGAARVPFWFRVCGGEAGPRGL